MKVAQRFLLAQGVWTLAIFVLILPVTTLSADSGTAVEYARWLTHALRLAAFAAGITVARDVFAQTRPWRPLGAAIGAAGVTAMLTFVLAAFVVPALGADATVSQLAREMSTAGLSWESRNPAAWRFYIILLTPVSVLLFAVIGIQVGVWATYALPVALRRPLYWAVGIGLIVSGYSVFDTTYESVVLHTPADIGFAAFYTLLLPAGLCAGLALPTLALLRGARIRGGSP